MVGVLSRKPNATTRNPKTYLKEIVRKHNFIYFVIIKTRANGLWANMGMSLLKLFMVRQLALRLLSQPRPLYVMIDVFWIHQTFFVSVANLKSFAEALADVAPPMTLKGRRCSTSNWSHVVEPNTSKYNPAWGHIGRLVGDDGRDKVCSFYSNSTGAGWRPVWARDGVIFNSTISSSLFIHRFGGGPWANSLRNNCRL